MSHSPYATIDANGYLVTWCPLCGGSSHPSTGCAYSPTFVVCWACTLAACRWIQQWTNMRGRRTGTNFYDHVENK